MGHEELIGFTADGVRLEGCLAAPERSVCGAVLCHPHPQYGGTMDNLVVRAAAAHLQNAGVATLRFNFRSVASGKGPESDLAGERTDARAAVDFLLERSGLARVALVGYSFGAVVALQVGRDHCGVDRLIAIAPPLSMSTLDFLGHCRKPKLLLVGDRDQFCPYEVFRHAVAALPDPKTSACLRGADHFLMGFEDQVGEQVVRFISAAAGE